jgi:hypothetical protein
MIEVNGIGEHPEGHPSPRFAEPMSWEHWSSEHLALAPDKPGYSEYSARGASPRASLYSWRSNDCAFFVVANDLNAPIFLAGDFVVFDPKQKPSGDKLWFWSNPELDPGCWGPT